MFWCHFCFIAYNLWGHRSRLGGEKVTKQSAVLMFLCKLWILLHFALSPFNHIYTKFTVQINIRMSSFNNLLNVYLSRSLVVNCCEELASKWLRLITLKRTLFVTIFVAHYLVNSSFMAPAFIESFSDNVVYLTCNNVILWQGVRSLYYPWICNRFVMFSNRFEFPCHGNLKM